jgi:hypothetical protein
MKKSNSKKTIVIILLLMIVALAIYPKVTISANKLIDETLLITDSTLKFITPSEDYRAYFMLQSIDETTVILVGNFVDPEKVITLIIDEGSDNTIDNVIEYYPETKKYKRLKKLNSKYINPDIAELKKEIIEGTIFEKKYSYQMSSLKELKKKLSEGKNDIFFTDAGTRVIINDPETAATIMADFFFKVRDDRYDLKFKTIYYKLYNTKIQPPLSFSVYCRNSKDPVVAKYVKELLNLVRR